mmetsp:Transcript_10246/g.44532  ORF Transcript_10246/g.44532 Transcript_10246/m.44532 type:complete len:215 (+) Transcript_10246:2703-3347(+)
MPRGTPARSARSRRCRASCDPFATRARSTRWSPRRGSPRSWSSPTPRSWKRWRRSWRWSAVSPDSTWTRRRCAPPRPPRRSRRRATSCRRWSATALRCTFRCPVLSIRRRSSRGSGGKRVNWRRRWPGSREGSSRPSLSRRRPRRSSRRAKKSSRNWRSSSRRSGVACRRWRHSRRSDSRVSLMSFGEARRMVPLIIYNNFRRYRLVRRLCTTS